MKTFKFFQTVFVLLVACSLTVYSQQQKIAGNYQFKTECLGVELDGSVTLKAWGNGRNRFDAVAQAKKNAIYDVLFKGILDGSKECNAKPLVPEVNAFEKYEDYFNKFFSDKSGDYLKFVSMRDERLDATIFRKKLGNSGGVTYSCIVRVKRSELKQLLIKDGIIK